MFTKHLFSTGFIIILPEDFVIDTKVYIRVNFYIDNSEL